MFSNLKVGDYVLISKGLRSSNIIRRKVSQISTRTFKCENDDYTYNISNGKAWGMSFRYACLYDELKWKFYETKVNEEKRRIRALNVIKSFIPNEHKYTTEQLEMVAKVINEITINN